MTNRTYYIYTADNIPEHISRQDGKSGQYFVREFLAQGCKLICKKILATISKVASTADFSRALKVSLPSTAPYAA